LSERRNFSQNIFIHRASQISSLKVKKKFNTGSKKYYLEKQGITIYDTYLKTVMIFVIQKKYIEWIK